MKEVILIFSVLTIVGAIPLNREEKCDRIDKELQSFQGILANSNDLDIVIDNVLMYFNVSDLYQKPLFEKITELCSKTKEVKNLN